MAAAKLEPGCAPLTQHHKYEHHMGISEKKGYRTLGVLIIRILLFRILYWGPLFSETPICIVSINSIAYSVHATPEDTKLPKPKPLQLSHACSSLSLCDLKIPKNKLLNSAQNNEARTAAAGDS